MIMVKVYSLNDLAMTLELTSWIQCTDDYKIEYVCDG